VTGFKLKHFGSQGCRVPVGSPRWDCESDYDGKPLICPGRDSTGDRARLVPRALGFTSPAFAQRSGFII